MSTNSSTQYVRIKANDGQDLLCPIRTEIDPDNVAEEIIDDCFERDVLERYAGNIEIVEK